MLSASMICVSDALDAAAPTPSRPRTRIVLSPAIVPATSGEPDAVDALRERRGRAGRGPDRPDPCVAPGERERELVEQPPQHASGAGDRRRSPGTT